MNDDIGPKLNELAGQLLDISIASDDEAFKLDCFKVLSGHWINTAKLGKKKPGDEDGDGEKVVSMKAMRAAYKQAAQGE